MNIIKQLNEEIAIIAQELNEEVISFNENCLFLDVDSVQLTESAIDFLSKLSSDIVDNQLDESNAPNKLGVFSVLQLMRKHQEHPDKLLESSSIRAYMQKDNDAAEGLTEAQSFLLESLGKLKSEYDENGLSLRTHYLQLLENDAAFLNDEVLKLKSQYQKIKSKL
jgi:hypothetical protein